ncbi:hypothetical protein ACWEVD_01840 [Nocardia thailandica]
MHPLLALVIALALSGATATVLGWETALTVLIAALEFFTAIYDANRK